MALTNKLSAIGDAIRAKTGKSEKLTLDSMVTEINSITTGGSGGAAYDIVAFINGSAPLSEMIELMKPIQNNCLTIGEYALYKKCINDASSAIWQDYQPLFNFPVVKKIKESGLNQYMDTIDSFLVEKYKLCTLNLPQCEKLIGSNCCANLKVGSVNAPKLRTINNGAFSSCTYLKEINLPKITTLESQEFSYCNSLKKARFDSLKAIKSDYYFQAPFCMTKILDTLILGSPTLVTLANQDGLCGNITPDSYDVIPPIHPAYKGGLPQGYIYVPKALVEQYKVATNWVVFADKFRAIEDYPEICGGA